MNLPRLNPWREIALVCLILMEGAWAALLVSLLVQVQGWIPLPQAFACLSLVSLAAHLTARGLLAFRARLWLRRGLVLGLVLGSLWASFAFLAGYPAGSGLPEAISRLGAEFSGGRLIPGEFLLAGSVLLIWLRGLALARDPVGSQTIVSSFQYGMLAWFLFGSASPLLDSAGALPLFGIFLFGGLVGMAASRVYEISALRGARRAGWQRGWAGAVVGSAGLLAGIGLLAALASNGLLGDAARLLAWLAFTVLTGVLALVLLVVFAAAAGLAPWLAEHINIGAVLRAFEQMGQRLREAARPLVDSTLLRSLAEWAWNSRAAALVGLLAVLVVTILGWLRFQRWAESQQELEGSEGGVSLADALRLARAALRGQLDRALAGLRRRMGWAGARRALAAARVRWVYARLMRLAGRLDRPRLAAQTPLEFLPVLDGLFPDCAAELRTITQAYLRVRYGELPESQAEVNQVLAAWERVRRSRK